MKSPLPLAECDARIAAPRESMAHEGLEALLVAGKGHAWSGRGYVGHLTDFHLWSHDCLILLPRDGAPMLAVTSHAVARKIAERRWVTDAQGDYMLVRSIADAMRAKGLTTARIGTVGTDWMLPAGRLAALRVAVPGARYEPADALFDAVRAIESPVEITRCSDLWTLMRTAMDGFEAALKPGLSSVRRWPRRCGWRWRAARATFWPSSARPPTPMLRPRTSPCDAMASSACISRSARKAGTGANAR